MVLAIPGRSVGSYWRPVGGHGRSWDLGYGVGWGIYLGYFGDISGDIWGISWDILGIYWGYLGNNWGISWVYLSRFLHICHV